jgi:TRAP-type C4-dicarboxylate transport system permease small subunit
MKKYIILFDKLIDILAYISGALVFVLMVSISAEICSRKILGTSIDWTVEISEHITYFITFLGAAWILKHNQHIRTDVVLEMLQPRRRLALEIFCHVLGAAVCLFIAYRAGLTTVDLWLRQINTVTDLELPMAPLIAVMCIGMLLLSIEFMRESYNYIKQWKTGAGNDGTSIKKNVLAHNEEIG